MVEAGKIAERITDAFFELIRFGFDFLDAIDIGRLVKEPVKAAFFDVCSQAVHVPRDDPHVVDYNK
jgi:hypothetical protein